MVRFLNSQGIEIATRRSTSNTNTTDNMITERIPKHCLVVPEEQMYQMQQYLYEAKHREAVSLYEQNHMHTCLNIFRLWVKS